MSFSNITERAGISRTVGLREVAGMTHSSRQAVVSLREILAIPAPVFDALIAIRRFESSSSKGLFPKISKSKLVSDLRKTVRDPLQVDQQSTPFCGPASIAYELVRRDPAEFVRACQEIYETGAYRVRGEKIEASGDLKGSRSPISAADWIFCATLRDEANLLFDVDADEGALVNGLTTSGEMEMWTRVVLGMRSQHSHGSTFSGEVKALRSAQSSIDRGGVAFLKIHSDMLNRPGSDSDPKFPDHWIVLHGETDIGPGDHGRVSFRAYSWGKEHKVNLPKKRFENLMWGSVVGY
ncbi:hypothetical protein FQV27_18065 [Paracoccus aurantiacus]|uniref:Uncharacterized protein n=1 Tax=Paracoccus aurantiacus TaxID=2599412 RepID=A0A5C6RP15_9RHOB|nr:hypothetical protein [Paracoccus aurantiacus]TXB64078.1 hypothetical protein FQV27_18065 [Paracoccus aurantiacus]